MKIETFDTSDISHSRRKQKCNRITHKHTKSKKKGNQKAIKERGKKERKNITHELLTHWPTQNTILFTKEPPISFIMI